MELSGFKPKRRRFGFRRHVFPASLGNTVSERGFKTRANRLTSHRELLRLQRLALHRRRLPARFPSGLFRCRVLKERCLNFAERTDGQTNGSFHSLISIQRPSAQLQDRTSSCWMETVKSGSLESLWRISSWTSGRGTSVRRLSCCKRLLGLLPLAFVTRYRRRN